MNLTRHIIDAVDRYWAEEVQILSAWQDGPAAACVVYRRTIDPVMTPGCRLEFHAEAADGTIEGFARDVAVNLAGPVGTLISRSRQDQYSIVWVAVPEDRPTPKPPVEVVRRKVNLSFSDPDPDPCRHHLQFIQVGLLSARPATLNVSNIYSNRGVLWALLSVPV